MEATIRFCIAYHWVNGLISILIKQTAYFLKICTSLCKVVIIYKIITRIIRWVYVNHLYLAKIGLSKYLQHLKIISLYIKILSIIKIHTLLFARTQSHSSWCIRFPNCLALIRPCKLIAFLTFSHNFIAKLRLQFFKVNSRNNLAIHHLFRNTSRKQTLYFLDIRAHHIKALHFKFIHRLLSYSVMRLNIPLIVSK